MHRTLAAALVLILAAPLDAQDTTKIKDVTVRVKADMDSIVSQSRMNSNQVLKNNRAETRVRARMDTITASMRSVIVPPEPVTGVEVNPGSSIQTAVNANPAGTVFILKAGTHVQQAIVPKAGNIFRGEGMATTILDGQNTTAMAFYAWNGSAW